MRDWLFSKTNFYLFGLCVALLVLGYVFLGMRGPEEYTAGNEMSKSVAPAILVFVYCGLIPFAILYGYGKENVKDAKK